MQGKQFKAWERAFTPQQIEVERRYWVGSYRGDEILEKWPYKVNQWTQEQVQRAVYEAEDTESWQRFRAALKGTTTHEKLIALRRRWNQYNSEPTSMLEACRIDNYLGALVRGGQLNRNYEIVR